MRIVILLLLFSGNLTAGGPAQSSAGKQAQTPFSITVSVPKTEIKAGSSVELMVLLKNTSDYDINTSSTYYTGVDNGYQYDVRTERGAVVRPKKQRIKGPLLLSGRMSTLKPGESHESTTMISDEFDMTKPGKYVIQLSRPISGNPHDGVVKSNKITVTVTP